MEFSKLASRSGIPDSMLTYCFQTFVPSTSVTFVSKASVESGTIASYGLRKRVEAVKNCRNIGKKDMKYNDAMPKMKVDPETYVSHDDSAWLLKSLNVRANLVSSYRSLKQMGWSVKLNPLQNCH